MKALVEHCANLERVLRGKGRQLLEAQAAGSDPILQTQLANISQEHDRANTQVQELPSEGLKLEARYHKLKQ